MTDDHLNTSKLYQQLFKLRMLTFHTIATSCETPTKMKDMILLSHKLKSLSGFRQLTLMLVVYLTPYGDL